MPSVVVSDSERQFIAKGVEAGCRSDGRKRLEWRPLSITTGVLPQASGSCRVTCCSGTQGTSVLVSVRVAVESIQRAGSGAQSNGSTAARTDGDDDEDDGGGEIDDGDGEVDVSGVAASGDVGRILVKVSCSPGTMGWMKDREVQDVCTELSQTLTRMLNSSHGGIDLHDLCIVPGSTCWVVYIDALILEFGGNALDYLSIGVRGALLDALRPSVSLAEVEGHVDFDVGDEETEPILGAENVPICITLSQINKDFIVDASVQEEACSSVMMTFALNPQGQLTGMYKSGHGLISPSLVTSMIQSVQGHSKNVFEQLELALSYNTDESS